MLSHHHDVATDKPIRRTYSTQKLGHFESLMFAVELLAISVVFCSVALLNYVLNMPPYSHFTFQIPLEVLHDN